MDQVIVPALGDDAECFDIDAIFALTFEYRVDTNDRGQELLNTAGFEQVVSTEEFWAVVQQHEIDSEDDGE